MDGKDWVRRYRVKPDQKVSLKRDYDPDDTAGMVNEDAAERLLAEDIERLADYQEKLYAQNQYAILIIIQAMDAAGKDSLIKHVMTGLNPQGTQVFSFKTPNSEELDHTYLWRHMKSLPERGRIGIHNRSHYEEVLVVRVHPEFLVGQSLPEPCRDGNIFSRRYREINDFERHLADNGTVVVKFFLHVSKKEQKKRFLDRIEQPSKNWKFSLGDVKERGLWDQYMDAYEEMLEHTSTDFAPWYVIPADHKWFTRLTVARILAETFYSLDLRYPEISEKQRQELLQAKQVLEAEDEGTKA
jgi:PPK2 family polyphosphate:nucleotide phosphotransferase